MVLFCFKSRFIFTKQAARCAWDTNGIFYTMDPECLSLPEVITEMTLLGIPNPIECALQTLDPPGEWKYESERHLEFKLNEYFVNFTTERQLYKVEKMVASAIRNELIYHGVAFDNVTNAEMYAQRKQLMEPIVNYKLGLKHFKTENYKEARKYWSRAAFANHPKAKFAMARIYEYGIGVEPYPHMVRFYSTDKWSRVCKNAKSMRLYIISNG